MRHRASRLQAVVAALLLAIGALFATVGVASLASSTPDPSTVTTPRPQHAEARHEAFAPRAPSASSRAGAHLSGPHLDLTAVVAALGAVVLALLGWCVSGRARDLLPRLVVAPLGARAPPALV